MALIVQKYGGTSLATIQHIKAVAKHVAQTAQAGDKVIAVVSAMGRQTDEYIQLAHQVSPNPSLRELDMLLTVGERISMALLAIALQDLGIRSVSLTGSQSGILTDNCHGNARIQKVLGDRIRQSLQDQHVVIVAGFQGMSEGTKEITTLGRGGTDLTATAIAHTLKADSCQIYKDVEGICTADPDIVTNAQVIKRLTWRQLLDLTWNGAGVVHARAAHLALKYRIPLEIRSSFHLDRPGTLVTGDQTVESVTFTSITYKEDQVLLRLHVGNDHLALTKGVRWLWEQGESPQLSQISRQDQGDIEITQVLSAKFATRYVEFLRSATKQPCKVLSQSAPFSAVNVVGEGFWQSPETVDKLLQALPSAPLFVDSRNTVLTIGVTGDCNPTVQALHKMCFKN